MLSRFDTEQIRMLEEGFSQSAASLRRVASLLDIELHTHIGQEFVLGHEWLALRALQEHAADVAREFFTIAQRMEDLATLLHLSRSNVENAEHEARTMLDRAKERARFGLSSATVVSLLRAFATDIDIITAGITTGPVGMVWQSGWGRPGPDYTAFVLSTLSTGFGHAENQVTVRRVGAHTVNAPLSLSQLAERVPRASQGGHQITVERYGSALTPTWVVYYGGTVDMSLPAEDEPWDLQSNLDAMANKPSASLVAAQEAAELAGIRPGDPVVHVGFSQGGLIAAQVAAQAPPNTAALVTFGAPVGHLDLSRLTGVIAVEHPEDLVPSLSGGGEHKPDDRHRVISPVFLRVPENEMLPAHDMRRYTETLEVAETREGQQLRDQKMQIMRGIEGPGTRSLWHAERKPSP